MIVNAFKFTLNLICSAIFGCFFFYCFSFVSKCAYRTFQLINIVVCESRATEKCRFIVSRFGYK